MTIKEFIHEMEYATCDITDCSEFIRFCGRLDVECAYGASRMCAIFPKEQKVLKIVRNDVCRDYCEMEADYYRKAKELGIAEMLLPIELFAVIGDNIRVYVQPMFSYSVENLPYKVQRSLMEKYGKATHSKVYRKICQGFFSDCPSSVWLGAAITLYGKKSLRLLEKWTKENRINDLHSGNCGFLNGKPILLDYGGYFG